MNISQSKTFKEEYCSSVVRIGEIFPIEGRDKIVKTLVNGMSIVIGKEDFKEGDLAVYCANETTLHELFLHLNSMYDDKELNVDKEQKGYVNNKGRIRSIKLWGVYSYGLLLTPQSIATFLNEPVEDIVKYLEKHVGEDFDTINDEQFIKVYVPPVKENKHVSKGDRRNAKLKRFNMLMEGSFRFHYDTKMFGKEVQNFNPEDKIYVSSKLHGTSAIFSNILTNIPTNWFKRMWRKFITHKHEFDQKYNLIYSSRTVIKNKFINPKQKEGGFYDDDVWGHWAQKLNGLIPKNYCIYGEIVGFTPNGNSIQKGYDYGCEQGKSKLMIYRLTIDGKEQEIPEVIKFGKYLKEKLGDDIFEHPLLFEGTLQELYPDVDVRNHWHENILENLKNEKKFYMEKNCPYCKNKVPFEGVVIRKADDPIAEAFKLKTNKFFERERGLIDKGEVDSEMEEEYSGC